MPKTPTPEAVALAVNLTVPALMPMAPPIEQIFRYLDKMKKTGPAKAWKGSRRVNNQKSGS